MLRPVNYDSAIFTKILKSSYAGMRPRRLVPRGDVSGIVGAEQTDAGNSRNAGDGGAAGFALGQHSSNRVETGYIHESNLAG
jgi:hypothetical protein